MPFDFRRIQGPESSEDYRQFAKKKEKRKLIKENGLRTDGRSCEDIRKIYLKTGVVSQAKGSAYIEMGKTKVLCSVFDPREKPRSAEHNLRGELYCEFKFASFSSDRRKGHMQDSEDKEYSLLLKNALEPAVCLHEFPNFQVDVHILVLEDDGSSLAASITCSGLALADAAVPMYDLVVGATKVLSGDTVLMDPTAAEEAIALDGQEHNNGAVTVALLPVFNQVTQMVHVGHADPDRLEVCLAELVAQGSKIHSLVQSVLVSSVKQQLRIRDSAAEDAEKHDEVITS